MKFCRDGETEWTNTWNGMEIAASDNAVDLVVLSILRLKFRTSRDWIISSIHVENYALCLSGL